MPKPKTDVTRLAEIKQRREAGETLQSIADAYGVSRQRISQICQKNSIEAPPMPEPLEVLEAIESQLKDGAKSVREAARLAGVSYYTALISLKDLGLKSTDLVEQQSSYKIEHRYDGQKFHHWTVNPGTYDFSNRTVEVTCVCGTVKRNSLANMMAGTSRSCGCRMNERMVFPWRNKETGEQIIGNAAVGRRIRRSQSYMTRCLTHGLPVYGPYGDEWIPLRDLAISHSEHMRTRHMQPSS